MLPGRSLCIFSPRNRIRHWLKTIIIHKYFEWAILFLIFLSTFLIVVENPNRKAGPTTTKLYKILDNLMTFCFMLECLVKIIVWGFCCNGSDSYIKSGWNKMDFFIILISTISFLPFDQNYNVVKVLRIFRVLRPLRLVNRFPFMRIAIESIFTSVPQYANLLMIIIMQILLFSILGTALFKGKFDLCHMDNIMLGKVGTKWDCFDLGGEWYTPSANFDNTVNSMETLFASMTTEGWVQIMWAAVDTTEVNMIPKVDNHPIFIFYFVTFIILSAIIALNLFVGVVIDSNARETKKLLNNNQLTPLQNEYTDIMFACYSASPRAQYISKGNRVRDTLYRYTSHRYFEQAITYCIIFNTLCMSTTFYQQPEIFSTIMKRMSFLFTVIYTIEAALLIYVDSKAYFMDTWRQFDFIIVVIAIVGILCEYII